MKSITSLVIVMIMSQTFAVKDNSKEFSIESNSKFCQTKQFDAIFTDYKSQVRLTRKDIVWTYNQKDKKVLSQSILDTKEVYHLLSMAHISAIPKCQVNSEPFCADINQAKDMLIMFYRSKDNDFDGSYQVRRLLGQKVTTMSVLPFGLRHEGIIYDLNETFWPKMLSENSTDLDIKHTNIIYNPVQYELIIVVNGRSKGSSLCSNRFDAKRQWTEGWQCSSIDPKWRYTALFSITNNIYAMAVSGFTNVLFTYKQNQLISKDIDIHRYMGCNVSTRSGAYFEAVDDPLVVDKPSNKSMIWIFVTIFAIIFIVTVLTLLAFVASRKQTANKKSNAIKAKDIKGKDLDDSRIGVIDSKLSWDMKISSMSKEGSDESLTIRKPNKMPLN